MRYYYAVIHCNSPQTAEKIYEEYNNYEFELSNIRLNLSYISDSLKFPQEAKETANELPPGYSFEASNSLTRALNHTKVKLTWDETDPKRLRKFDRIMNAANPDDIDDDEYREFLASGTEEEDSNADKSDDEVVGRRDSDKIEEYRRKLLGGLSSSSNANDFKKRDL
jgi:hypothetical protein